MQELIAQLEEKIEISNFDEQRVSLLLELAKLYLEKKDFQQAEYIILEAMTIAQILGAETKNQDCHFELGKLYTKTGNSYRALDYMIRAKEINDSNAEKNVRIRMEIAALHNYIGNADKAVQILAEAIHYSESLESLELKAELHRKIGKNYNYVGLYKQAFDEFLYAINFYKQIQNIENYVDCLQEIAFFHLRLKEYDVAKKILRNLQSIISIDSFPTAYLFSELSFSRIYFENHDYQNALRLLQFCEANFDKIDNKPLKRQVFQLMNEVAEALENYDLAYCTLEKLMAMETEMFNDSVHLEMEKVKQKNEVDLQGIENEMLQVHNNELEDVLAEMEEAYKKLEHTQENVVKLEKKNASLAIAVTANHEINQPLMIIQGSMDLLSLQASIHNISGTEEYLKDAQASINAIENVLNQLKELTFSVEKNLKKTSQTYGFTS